MKAPILNNRNVLRLIPFSLARFFRTEGRAQINPVKGSARDLAVEGLRGLAALSVFLAHMLTNRVQGWGLPGWAGGLVPMDASAAVMVFFCLSGYVIGLTYPEATTAPWVSSYLQRRAIRLLPVYFLGILLACAAATDLDPWNLVGHFLFLQNYCDYAGFWVLPMETNGNLWSLNYEVLYYLLFIPILAHRIPLGRVALLSGAVLLLAWYTAYLPLFLGCYAAGFLY